MWNSNKRSRGEVRSILDGVAGLSYPSVYAYTDRLRYIEDFVNRSLEVELIRHRLTRDSKEERVKCLMNVYWQYVNWWMFRHEKYLRLAALPCYSRSTFLSGIVDRFERKIRRLEPGSYKTSLRVKGSWFGDTRVVVCKIVKRREHLLCGGYVHSSTERSIFKSQFDDRRYIGYVDGLLLVPRPEQENVFRDLAANYSMLGYQ